MSTAIATHAVSVLNASELPIGHTKLGRAIHLVLNGVALIHKIDESKPKIKSISGTEIPWPKAIIMLKLINVPFDYRPEFFSRAGVLKRDEYTCGYCLRTPKDVDEAGMPLLMTHDHIFPKSRGGKDEWMNAITACNECNWAKGDRTPEEADMPLLIQPTIPWKVYMRSNKPRKRKSR